MTQKDAMTVEEALLQIQMLAEQLPVGPESEDLLAYTAECLRIVGHYHARAIDEVVAQAVSQGIFATR